MGAELLASRPLAIEAIEDRGELAFRDAGSGIIDRNDHRSLIALEGEGEGATGRAEGNRVGDELAEDLSEPVLNAGNDEIGRPRTVRQDEAQVRRVPRRSRLALLYHPFPPPPP